MHTSTNSHQIVMLSDLLSTTEQVQRLATLTASQVPDDFLAFLVLSFAKSSAILATVSSLLFVSFLIKVHMPFLSLLKIPS